MGTIEEPALPVQPGDLVADKYRVERILAQGGMGVVVVAHHEQLDQRFAVKFLLPHAAGSAEAVARFLREAQAAARIQSEHVCRVFDVGTLAGGEPYMAMELLDGTDLSAELSARGTLPVVEAVSHVVQALDAIVEAHRRGVVHRDLKPSNLFLARRDDGSLRVKVLDFGISKIEPSASSPADFKLTSTQALLGSPAYMSPEQVRSTRDVDARTDIWSLGVILHESLAGGTLFAGSTLGEVFSKIREDPVPLLTDLRADVPAELAEIVARCLQRKPADRFATAADLRDALRAFLGRVDGAPAGAGLAGPGRASIASDAALAQTGVALSGDRSLPAVAPRPEHTVDAWVERAPARSRGRLWLAVAVATLLCGGAGGWLFAGRLGGAGTGAPAAGAHPLAGAGTQPPQAPAETAAPVTTVVPAGPASAPDPGVTAPEPPVSAAPTAAPAKSAAPGKGPGPKVPAKKAGSLDDVLGNQH
jgi:serine/threonine-protein kinase